MLDTQNEQNDIKIKKYLTCFTDLTETEIEILLYLSKVGQASVENVAIAMNISKPTANKYLENLYQYGFIMRMKDTTRLHGRPSYIYLHRKDKLKEKIINEIKEISEKTIKLVEKSFNE